MSTAETSVKNPPTSYDLVPYPRQCFAQSHPDRLNAIATLFNLKPQQVDNCRVLELGCASGDNIVPMAYQYPNSTFVGVDLSSRELEEGQKLVEQLGLKNVELKNINILDVNESMGKFDYIIAHGIFSWTPTEVQEKMLQICREQLTPNGVAYISYNTYPGWHFRGMIRDMMLYHTANLSQPAAKAQQARALLDFLAQNVPTQNNAYSSMLKSELDMLRQLSDSYLLHDHLEETNTPVYFHQFIERANKHGLQYLAEADFATMITSNLPKTVSETLAKIATDIIPTEQYMDFVRNRTFRQTLLVHQELQINRALGPLSVMPFNVGTPAKTADANAPETPGVPTIKTNVPLLKAAFDTLSEVWPSTVRFGDLVKTARERSGTNNNDDPEQLANSVLAAYAGGVSVLRTQPDQFVTKVSDKPKASELARVQARSQHNVTNLLHENIQLDVVSREFIQLLDGTRDFDALVEGLNGLVQNDTIRVHEDGNLLKDGPRLQAALAQSARAMLNGFARTAILEA